MTVIVELVVHVEDRTWETMSDGVSFQQWPGDEPPEIGRRVVIFDKDLDFTQHKVIKANGMAIEVGPALPWLSPKPSIVTPRP